MSNKIAVKSVKRITLDESVPVFDVTNLDGQLTFCLSNGVVVHNTAKLARNPHFQETLPIKGKVQNCVVGSTLVLLADGSRVPISELTEEWEGIGYDLFQRSVSVDKMSAVFPSGLASRTIRLEFDDGYTLECTPEHLILTTEGYVAAEDLTQEHELVTANSAK